jgi:sulfatase maturation enzyme AslB (radical SAM superfamily)
LDYYPEIKIISFLGGEPLLFEKEIRRFIDLTNNKIKKYIITTNGLNLNKENILYFIKNHVQLNISLDGNE